LNYENKQFVCGKEKQTGSQNMKTPLQVMKLSEVKKHCRHLRTTTFRKKQRKIDFNKLGEILFQFLRIIEYCAPLWVPFLVFRLLMTLRPSGL
jgi:hypothetical protein